MAEVEVNGTPFKVEFDKPVKKAAAPVAKPVAKSAAPAPAAAPVAKPAAAAGGAGTAVTSPLPGVILDVCVKEGDAVKRGQTVMVLEAMKMENAIEATADGTVTAIKVGKGDSVLEGAPLVIIG
jgi:biotin carboxyl carrier protein